MKTSNNLNHGQFRSKLDVHLNRNIIEHQHLTMIEIGRDLNYLMFSYIRKK